jgi:hypothetical protein
MMVENTAIAERVDAGYRATCKVVTFPVGKRIHA